MSDQLEPHPLAALFPPIPDDELQALADDIRAHGQREPVLTFEGKVLDGWNRVRACRLINRKPWVMEFDPASAKTTPEQLVISANVRRRHLTPPQLAALAVEWAERIEQDWAEGRSNTFVARVEKIEGQAGRPKSTALQDTARLVGVSVSAAYEARRIKTANEPFFAELKAGTRSLGSALDEIQPPAPEPGKGPAMSATEAAETTEETPADDQPLKPAATKPGPAKPAEMVRPPPSAAVLTKASNRILAICGKAFHAEVRGRLSPEETVQFSKLTDAEMLKVKTLLLRGWVFLEALRDVIDELTPDDDIRALLTRAVQGGGTYRCTIAGFTFVLANEQSRPGLEARLAGWPAK
jgi:hypothetical protein